MPRYHQGMSFVETLRRFGHRIADPFFLTEVDGYEPDEPVMHTRGETEPAVGTSAIIVQEGGAVLLGKRRGSHAAGVWSTPGGHLDHGETFADCIRREVAEETGLTTLTCDKVTFTEDFVENGTKHYVTLYFLVTAAPGEPKLLEPNKCEGWHWVRPDEVDGELWPGMHEAFATLRERGVL